MEAESFTPNYAGRRDRRRGTSPTVSIVIASNDSADVLESRISSLRARFDPSQTEYVIAWAGSPHAGAELKRRFPYVHFVTASANTSPAELRMQGIKAAMGDIVLLLDQGQAQGADVPSVAIMNPTDVARERGSSLKRVDRLALRASRENASVASTG